MTLATACIGYRLIRTDEIDFKCVEEALEYAKKVDSVMSGKLKSWGIMVFNDVMDGEFDVVVYQRIQSQSIEYVEVNDVYTCDPLPKPDIETTSNALNLCEDFLGKEIDRTPRLFLKVEKS